MPGDEIGAPGATSDKELRSDSQATQLGRSGPPSPFGHSLDGTDDGGGISESSADQQLHGNGQAAQSAEPPRTSPS
jgi:hypothetical protein